MLSSLLVKSGNIVGDTVQPPRTSSTQDIALASNALDRQGSQLLCLAAGHENATCKVDTITCTQWIFFLLV